ncbi:unnamed protein product [Prunus armeniaca]|uniref:F-box associated beta-propeller type 3 domain-containing protein n=1 Tax=Prunus armeniaca TaxID=36596 RepID=A0A6J5VZS4_PRUAR|nr:unnamed protein product [Prunus armeniaca]
MPILVVFSSSVQLGLNLQAQTLRRFSDLSHRSSAKSQQKLLSNVSACANIGVVGSQTLNSPENYFHEHPLPFGSLTTGHFLVDLDRIGSQSDVALQLFSNLKALCMTVVGLCNGFLCHYDFNSDFTSHLHISNPGTCEFFSLPIPSNRDNGDCYGFGFSPISDVYKLVWVTSLGGEPDQVTVLTVGSGVRILRRTYFDF